jgi:hypothetical protein
MLAPRQPTLPIVEEAVNGENRCSDSGGSDKTLLFACLSDQLLATAPAQKRGLVREVRRDWSGDYQTLHVRSVLFEGL